MGCAEDIIQEIIKTAGGRRLGSEKIEMLRKLVQADTSLLDINKIMGKVLESKNIDKIQEAWHAGILSSFTTQTANIIGNSMAFLTRFPEKIASASAELVVSTLRRVPRERFFGEVVQEATFGMWAGIKEGTRRGIFAITHEIPESALTKLDLRKGKAIMGLKGQLIRTPFRLLNSVDEFFKGLNYQTEIHALAYRNTMKAIKNKQITKNQSKELMAKLISEPTESMVTRAFDITQENVFQKQLGSMGQKLLDIRNDPIGRYFLPFIIPFVRTPINLTKFGLKRTPLNIPIVFGKVIRSQALLSKQKAGVKLTSRELKSILQPGDISDELSKVIIGSFIGITTMAYTKEGFITGQGPTNPNERKAWERTHQPYSIKIKDKWVSYARLEPMTIPLGLAADWAEIDDFIEDGALSMEAISPIVFAISKNIINKTFMQGLSRAFNALSDPDRFGDDFIKGLIGSLIPSGVANIAGAIDPAIRKREGLVDVFKARTPGLSRELIPRRDLWGNELKRTELSPLLAAISPIKVRSVLIDKVEDEMSRLGIFSAPPNVKELRGLEISPKELDIYIVEAGQLAKKLLDNLVQRKGYDLMSDSSKESLIKKIIRYTRKAAGSRILVEKILKSREESR